MGTSISMKWSKEDQALQAWREMQPEKDSDLIRAALYALMEKRSGGNFPSTASPMPDPPEWIDRFMQAIDSIPAAIRDGVLEALRQDASIRIYQNEQPTQTAPEPVLKAKRPGKSARPPIAPPAESDPDELETATANFMNMFS